MTFKRLLVSSGLFFGIYAPLMFVIRPFGQINGVTIAIPFVALGVLLVLLGTFE